MENELVNTSGQGKGATIPPGIDKWNWGAFLLGWIWGIGNRTYISFLLFVPFLNVLMVFLLGIKGSVWAWRNNRWESVEHFQRVQARWGLWGAAVWVVMISLIVGGSFLMVSLVKDSIPLQMAMNTLQSNPQAKEWLGQPIKSHLPKGSISVSGPSGKAEFEVGVDGPKGKGKLFITALKESGQWNLQALIFEEEGTGTRHSLIGGSEEEASSAESEAMEEHEESESEE